MTPMFTLPSLPKLLILLAIIWVAWRMFRRVSGPSGDGSRGGGSGGPGGGNRGTQSGGERPPERTIEDMVQCPKCGAYVPAKGGHDCSAEAKSR